MGAARHFFQDVNLQWRYPIFLTMMAPDTRHNLGACSDALAVIIFIPEAGAKIDRVTYAGKPISRTQLEDLVADAQLLGSLMQIAAKQGVPVETLLERGLEKSQNNDVFAAWVKQVSNILGVTEMHAAEVLLRRLARGSIPALARQKTP